MPLFFSPICNDQTFDANGDPLNGGQIETYIAESSTPAQTYTDDTGGTPQSNPIILNSLGYPTQGPIWLTGGISYKFIIKNAAGSTLRTIDNISGVNDASVSQSEWVESGLVPTYIGATSFSVPGDQTAILQINRRTRTTNTSGFIYSTISNSVFAAGITTVTLTNDSGVLDAGLSLVAYGLISSDDTSLPVVVRPVTTSGLTMATARGLGRITASTGAIEELTSTQWTANLVDAATDALPGKVELSTAAEFNTGTDTARVPPVNVIREQAQVYATAVALTNQTAVDFTAIPAWAKRIQVLFSGVSTNGTSSVTVQLGDAGGVETSGYLGASGLTSVSTAATVNATEGFRIYLAGTDTAAAIRNGLLTITKLDGNTWGCSGSVGASNAATLGLVGGSKALSATLDRVRITTVGGTDQFDAGTVNITYE